jgi:hypothetical protein
VTRAQATVLGGGVLLLLALLVSLGVPLLRRALGPPAPSATPSATASPTPSATVTPRPSATPPPSATLTPSATREPPLLEQATATPRPTRTAIPSATPYTFWGVRTASPTIPIDLTAIIQETKDAKRTAEARKGTLRPPRPTAKLTTARPCNCGGRALDCTDFANQNAAQACFKYCRSRGLGDVFGLDPDGDGQACAP